MRLFFCAIVALCLSACGQTQQAAQAPGCAHDATHQVEWSRPGAQDVITASSAGPSCAQAVVTLVVRNVDGDPLWAFASTYYDMRFGGVPPEGAPEVSDDEMNAFLSGWSQVTLQRTGELPEWRRGAATLSESASTFAYATPFDRDVYGQMRTRDLPMICYAAAVESSQCLIIDPATHAPSPMVAYGP